MAPTLAAARAQTPAPVENRRDAGQAWFEALVTDVHTELVPATNARCGAAGQARPVLSRGTYDVSEDTRLCAGADDPAGVTHVAWQRLPPTPWL